MSKYVIKYSYAQKDKRWVCGTNELFGFFLYADTEEQLKKSCNKTLKAFTGNKDLTGKDRYLFIINE